MLGDVLEGVDVEGLADVIAREVFDRRIHDQVGKSPAFHGACGVKRHSVSSRATLTFPVNAALSRLLPESSAAAADNSSAWGNPPPAHRTCPPSAR